MKKKIYRISLLLFYPAIVLLAMNFYGLFRPLGNEAIYSEQHSLFKDDVDRNAEKSIRELLKQDNIADRKAYFQKLVLAVNKTIAHYWSDEGRTRYHLTVPVYENYILWLNQFINPDRYKYYEYCDYRHALERKVGLCSQQAIITCGILEEKDIPCKIAGLKGHVVAMAEVQNGQYWILDSDYGIVIPYGIQQIEKDPSLVTPFYSGKLTYNDYSISQNKNNPIPLDKLIKIYGAEGNHIFNGVKDYCGNKYYKEKASYYLIWIIPLILMLPFLILTFHKNVNGNK